MSRKEEITAGLIEARKRILDAVSGLPPEELDEVFLGSWCIKDLLAHLVGWDYANMGAVKDIRAGRSPSVFEHWDPDWVKYNAELVGKFRRDDFAEMLGEIQQSHQELIEYVETVPAADIEKDFGIRSPDGTNITVEWFLQFEIEDEGRHYAQIEEWLKEAAGREEIAGTAET